MSVNVFAEIALASKDSHDEAEKSRSDYRPRISDGIVNGMIAGVKKGIELLPELKEVFPGTDLSFITVCKGIANGLLH